jgi:predicted nucleic acid-binding protein
VPTRGRSATYLDSSALVKLVAHEKESTALEDALAGVEALASCNLARVEIVRVARQKRPSVVEKARRLLANIELIQLDDELLDLAAELEGPLRSLDAIHLAAALELGDELEALVTYDARMTQAAEALGLSVVAPA